jgi:hypothetical protein
MVTRPCTHKSGLAERSLLKARLSANSGAKVDVRESSVRARNGHRLIIR